MPPGLVDGFLAGLSAGAWKQGDGRQPGIIKRAGVPAGGRAPGTSRWNRPVRPWTAGVQEGSTARCVRALAAVTLSDTGSQGERAHSRRYGGKSERTSGCAIWPCKECSARPTHAHVSCRCCIALGQVGMSCSLLVNHSLFVLWVPKTYATRRYSWITPPTRSRRRTRMWSRSVTSSGSGRSGAAWFRVRCGRCVL